MTECRAEVVDTTPDSAYKTGNLNFGIYVEGCKRCRVWFTVDIDFAEGSKERRFDAESSGLTNFTFEVDVDNNVMHISEPRDIRCDCMSE